VTDFLEEVKRMIGRRFSDKSVQEDITLWPFKVVAGHEDRPMVLVEYKGEEKRFSPQEISAMVLAKMRETAEVYLHVGQERRGHHPCYNNKQPSSCR
jgi:heat shock 70kDa protein 1/2/6/8